MLLSNVKTFLKIGIRCLSNIFLYPILLFYYTLCAYFFPNGSYTNDNMLFLLLLGVMNRDFLISLYIQYVTFIYQCISYFKYKHFHNLLLFYLAIWLIFSESQFLPHVRIFFS